MRSNLGTSAATTFAASGREPSSQARDGKLCPRRREEVYRCPTRAFCFHSRTNDKIRGVPVNYGPHPLCPPFIVRGPFRWRTYEAFGYTEARAFHLPSLCAASCAELPGTIPEHGGPERATRGIHEMPHPGNAVRYSICVRVRYLYSMCVLGFRQSTRTPSAWQRL